MSGSCRPLILIGLDGAEPRLLRSWMDDGTLPVLAALRHEGVCESVRTLAGFGDGALWPSLVTGVNPGRHGRYFRRQIEPRGYRQSIFAVDSDLQREPFWMALSRAGRKVAVLDVPYARSERDVNGLLLVDWLIHDRYGEPRGWPSDFAASVLAEFGDDPIDGNSDTFPKEGTGMVRLCGLMTERVRMKERLVSKILRDRPWDFLVTTFTEPHDLGHTAWHLHDPRHPRHDPDALGGLGDPLKSLYREIDRAIGSILANADPTAWIMVFAGLGMGPNYTANRVMDEILDRLDGREHRDLYGPWRTWCRGGSPKWMARLGHRMGGIRTARELRNRRFFAMPHNENSGAIRINLVGRERAGKVRPEEFDAVCGELEAAFLEMRCAGTGTPLVKQVVRVDRELHGDFMDAMPDLMVVWNRESPFDAVESARIGTISGARSWGRTGDHTPNAMIIVRGGELRNVRLAREPSVFDVTATIGALQGVDLGGIDGRPIGEITGMELHARV